MGKKFKELFFSKPSAKINKKSKTFKHYLIKEVFEDKYVTYLDELAKSTKVYIFSGVIRDFFLGIKENRDLDIVVEEIPSSFLNNLKEDDIIVYCKRNKFNGLKISFQNLNVDLWEMKDTWGIRKKKLPVEVTSLLKTPFFNFSSIVFDYVNSEFIVGEPFKNFLDNRVLNVVFSRNLEPESCLISTIHYARKYNLAISDKLSRWLRDKYNENYDYSRFQEKRFGESEFTDEDIGNFIENPEMYVL